MVLITIYLVIAAVRGMDVYESVRDVRRNRVFAGIFLGLAWPIELVLLMRDMLRDR